MKYRNLGRTGIRVSEVSFGAHLDEINVKDQRRRAEQIRAAIEGGINLFDIYDHSGYKQWKPMSKLLHPIRDQVIISLCTVWDSEKVEDEVNYALEIFKTDYIDLYRFVLTGNIKENEKRLSALLKLKREGKIRAVGAAVHVPSQTLSALKKYPEKLDFLMIPISYCFPRAISEGEPIAEQIRKYEIGVIAMKPLCGEYEQGGSHLLRIKPQASQLSKLKNMELSIGRIAIKALLQSELVSTVMPSMNSVEEVLDNIKASGDPFTEDERRILDIYCKELKKRGKRFFGNLYWLWNWR